MNANKAVAFAAAAAILILAGPVSGQIKYGGYLGLEYIDGQAESANPHASIENLLAGFLVQGRLGQKFGFAVEARARGVESFDINQAWAGYLASQAFTVRAGLYLVPFGSWNTASRPHETVLIRTPLNLEQLYPSSWRDLGLVIEGRVGPLTYAAYLGNGLAEGGVGADPYLPVVQQFSDNNTDKSKGGRLGLLAGSAIRAGLSYYTGKYDDQDMRDIILEGADFAWVTPEWELHGEYTKSFVENPAPFERGESEGFAIWASMGFRSFQPVGSYQSVKITDAYHLGDAVIDRSRWTAGFRFVLSQTLFVKFEYDWNLEEGTTLKNNQWQVQVALSF
jgi:hypothetical protein